MSSWLQGSHFCPGPKQTVAASLSGVTYASATSSLAGQKIWLPDCLSNSCYAPALWNAKGFHLPAGLCLSEPDQDLAASSSALEAHEIAQTHLPAPLLFCEDAYGASSEASRALMHRSNPNSLPGFQPISKGAELCPPALPHQLAALAGCGSTSSAPS